jgi:hypothetical protein
MAVEDDDKPWSEMHWVEQGWVVLWGVVGGVLVLALVALLVAVAVNETRWTFTTVHTERVCSAGHHGDCITRTRGLVKSIDEAGFTVAIDRAPYRRTVTSLIDPAPAVGTRVSMEDWHGRLVSIVTPARGRLHTNQWPSPRKDASEALAAWAALLFIPVLYLGAWLVEWRGRRRSRAAGALPSPEQHAHPS